MTLCSYDEVPYPSLPVRRSHPSHLAALARLFGLASPLPDGCRVLELGCASGGNLLPLAADFPGSSFVGIDLSARQVAAGQAAVQELGLRNISLHALDLNEFGGEFGTFDYILCHGVFSWVPRHIQDKILAIGRRQLAPDGVMFVSYNTYPGWHLRGVVRDMMAFHVRDLPDAASKVTQARALLDFLTASAAPTSETYRRLLQEEAAVLRTRDDGYLFHEHLEEVNEPFYFHQFVERAAAAELQYLADTDLASMLPTDLNDQVKELLRGASLLQQEQYLDFLRNRMFRGTLLCHREVVLERHLDSRRMAGCDVGLEDPLSLPRETGEATSPLVCETPAGRITVHSSLSRAALYLLREAWPACIPFDALLAHARRRSHGMGGGQTGEQQEHALARDLLALYLQKLIRLWVAAPACAARAATCPCTTPLARWQATRGNLVTNRRHETHQLADLETAVLTHLDGQHDRPALVSLLKRGLQRGEWAFIGSDSAPQPPFDLAQLVEQTLHGLAERALLIPA